MSDAPINDAIVEELERDILSAFGSAIIQFEIDLHQKLMVMSARHSLVTPDVFKKLLQDMYSKGYVSPFELHGRKAWKKMVIEDRIGDALTPRRMRTIGGTKTVLTDIPGLRDTAEHRVSESRILADDIVHTLYVKLFAGRTPDEQTGRAVVAHARAMRRALMESRGDFLDYLRTNAPTVQDEMKQLLETRGEDMLLVSLRLIEVKAR